MPTPSIHVPDLAALGHQIAGTRRAKGWSIDKLADASGVSRRAIINIEGARQAPRIDTLYALAVALGTPLADLVGVL